MVWLLIEITDQVAEILHDKAGATSAEEALAATETKIDRCLRQSAVTAARNVKYLLDPQEADLFIAAIVLELWEVLIQGALTTEIQESQILKIETGIQPNPSTENSLRRLIPSLIRS